MYCRLIVLFFLLLPLPLPSLIALGMSVVCQLVYLFVCLTLILFICETVCMFDSLSLRLSVAVLRTVCSSFCKVQPRILVVADDPPAVEGGVVLQHHPVPFLNPSSVINTVNIYAMFYQLYSKKTAPSLQFTYLFIKNFVTIFYVKC